MFRKQSMFLKNQKPKTLGYTIRLNFLINFFLKEVWEDEAITDEKINDLLTDIAYDLEFYEPSNGDWSIDTSIYYDGEKMDRMLDEAIKNIDTLLVNLG